ncbi:alpha/beta-hydrolase [Metschnikowia bicuspidata var. bicuspidata NRRL YB-4993]|uniref:Alpha/beta-hydrolase n=1 Tax=Metschnikowia bicuspidata var. bicuspidata NRRL YB-4993 TaxID=869754 RepID=A0A1A0HHZ6_9ASCO|nr:alpha/beta-hydrolase [Metschnikowia bicuspidata var. bicuspidata NRRL YB-4993]OBA23784.1 alpha/beta-hydrolase [Metschnikowia bicuspidata var. bicuspidata NRRL YB-4993]
MSSAVQVRFFSGWPRPSTNFLRLASSGQAGFRIENHGTARQPLSRHKYKRPGHPTAVPLHKLFSSQFPLSLRQLVEDYAMRDNPLRLQHDLLLALPFFPGPDGRGRRGEVVQTRLLSGERINEFVIYPASRAGQHVAPGSRACRSVKHLIMVHGYGAGLGFYLKNFEALLALDDWVVHAVDLLGYGCSSRPAFTAQSLAAVERFFHDSFGEWLRARGLAERPQQNMVVAHSMGAYLMATYGIQKQRDFCAKLVMVSPGAVIKHRRAVVVPPYFARLWERNISPFSLVRNAGPLGSKLVSMWSSRRFARLPPAEARLLHRYAYGIFQSPGSGEYMLNFLLAPGADARHPLVSRGIEKLACDVLWCYGKDDWMDKAGGELCSALINRRAGSAVKSTTCEIDNAGHHVYLDNPAEFNELVLRQMRNF